MGYSKNILIARLPPERMEEGGPEAERQAGLLSRATEETLVAKWQAGDEAALHRLILAHKPLVLGTVRAFRDCGITLPDLVQEGMIGLLEAARRFEPERGFRFSTFAHYWVRATVLDYVLRNWSVVAMGRSAMHKRLFFNLRRVRAGLERMQPDTVIDDEQLAQALDAPPREVARMRQRLAAGDQSLDAPMTPGGEASRLDALAAGEVAPADLILDRLEKRQRIGWLRQAWGKLTERERLILYQRLVRDCQSQSTLKELGARLGITAERVRQIEKAALAKLRRLATTSALVQPS